MNKDINEIKSYFTDDIRTQIREMSHGDMKDHLKALEGTPLWIAILKYTQERIGVIQDSFLSLDPLSEVVKIARYQGAITGMLDLQDAVLSLKFQSKKAEDPKYKSDQSKDDIGGGYGII